MTIWQHFNFLHREAVRWWILRKKMIWRGRPTDRPHQKWITKDAYLTESRALKMTQKATIASAPKMDHQRCIFARVLGFESGPKRHGRQKWLRAAKVQKLLRYLFLVYPALKWDFFLVIFAQKCAPGEIESESVFVVIEPRRLDLRTAHLFILSAWPTKNAELMGFGRTGWAN